MPPPRRPSDPFLRHLCALSSALSSLDFAPAFPPGAPVCPKTRKKKECTRDEMKPGQCPQLHALLCLYRRCDGLATAVNKC